MQQLKADLNYCLETKSVKVKKTSEKISKTTAKKDRRFKKTLEQSLLAQTLPMTTANRQICDPKAAGSKYPAKQSDNINKSKKDLTIRSSLSVVNMTAQNQAKTLTHTAIANTEIPFEKVEKSNFNKQAKVAKGYEKAVVLKSEKEAINSTGINSGDAGKLNFLNIKNDKHISKSDVQPVGLLKGSIISKTGNNTCKTIQKDLQPVDLLKEPIIGKTGNNTFKTIQGDVQPVDLLKEPIIGKTGNNTRKTIQGDVQPVDLLKEPIIGKTGNNTRKTIQKDVQPKQETKLSFVQTALTSEVTDSNLPSETKSEINNKELVKKSAVSKTLAAKSKTDINSVTIGKAGTIEQTTAENNGLNCDKTVLGKNQIDLIMSTMIQQIKTAPSSLEVSLKPEYLGKVSILLHSRKGLISVNFIAHNGQAFDLLNANIQSIKDNLEQQGISLQQMEVNVANQEQQNNQGGSYYQGRTRQHLPAIAHKQGYIESSEQNSLLPYKLNLLA